MKLCRQCKVEKTESEFNKNKSRKDGLNTICRVCSNENSRKYYSNNTDYHKKYIIKQNLQRRRNSRKIVDESKKGGCIICGEKEKCCLDFHHFDGDKILEVSNMVGHGYSKTKILEEIEKCILVCANCHRKIHANIINIDYAALAERTKVADF